MALMAAHGEITPMPVAAIFADTGAEPQEVYDWLKWLTPLLPFPVHVVQKGNLIDDSLAKTKSKEGIEYARTLIPAFIGGHGIMGRKCTSDYKIVPIRRKCKELLGLGKHDRWPKETAVIQWLGISLDEMQRMKSQIEAWQDFRHPLIEARMTRGDCLEWMRSRGYPEPPRSACFFCPFHSNAEWRRLSSEDFARAVQFEKDMQEALTGRLRGKPYLHSERIPLDEVDLSTAEDHGQLSFLDECAGMCGV